MRETLARWEAWMERHALSVALFAYLLVIFYCMMALCNVDPDLWGVLAMGTLVAQTFPQVPLTDPFSYTAFGQPWIYHEWGSGLLFHQTLRYFGVSGLFWLTWGVAAAQLALLWQSARLGLQTLGENDATPDRRRMKFLFLFSSSIFMMMNYLFLSVTRCQMFSFLGYTLTLYALQRARLLKETRTLWLLPPLFCLWANLHGGFAIGLVAIGFYLLAAVWERQRPTALRLALILILCVGATCINPYGLAYWGKLVPSWFMSRGNIAEWQNVVDAALPYAVIYTLFVGVWLWIAGWNWKQAACKGFPLALALFAATGYEGWMHMKLAPYCLLTMMSLGTGFRLPPAFYQGGRPRLIRINYLFAVLGPVLLALGAGGASLLYALQHAHPLDFPVRGTEKSKYDVHYPLGAMRFLSEYKAQGNLWLPFDWGEFATWTQAPRMRVSMDGRYETLYSPAVAQWNFDFYMPPYRDSVLKYAPQTNWILNPTALTALNRQIVKHHPEWTVCYRDELSTLFARAGRCPAKGLRYSNATVRLSDFLGQEARFKPMALPHSRP